MGQFALCLATAHEIANGFSVLAQDSFSCDLWFVLYTLKCRSTTGLWLSSQRAQWSNIAYCNIYLNEFLFSLALTPPITDWARVVNYSFYKIYNKDSVRITNDSWVVRLLMKIFIATNGTDSTIFFVKHTKQMMRVISEVGRFATGQTLWRKLNQFLGTNTMPGHI